MTRMQTRAEDQRLHPRASGAIGTLGDTCSLHLWPVKQAAQAMIRALSTGILTFQVFGGICGVRHALRG